MPYGRISFIKCITGVTPGRSSSSRHDAPGGGDPPQQQQALAWGGYTPPCRSSLGLTSQSRPEQFGSFWGQNPPKIDQKWQGDMSCFPGHVFFPKKKKTAPPPKHMGCLHGWPWLPAAVTIQAQGGVDPLPQRRSSSAGGPGGGYPPLPQQQQLPFPI